MLLLSTPFNVEIDAADGDGGETETGSDAAFKLIVGMVRFASRNVRRKMKRRSAAGSNYTSC